MSLTTNPTQPPSLLPTAPVVATFIVDIRFPSDDCAAVLGSATDFVDALTVLLDMLFAGWSHYEITDVTVTCDVGLSRRRSTDDNSSVMAAVDFALNAANQGIFMAELTTAVEDDALNISTETFAVVATEATLRDDDTTTATSATSSDSTTPTSTTSTASSDINLSSDGSTDSDESVFSGFALYAIIGAGAVIIILVVSVFAITRARRTARRDQGTRQSLPPDNSGWNSNTNNILSTEWRSEVRADPPDNRPPANFNPVYRSGDENHAGPVTRQETERERPRPVAAPRPTSVVDYMTQSAQQASGTDQVLYATTDDASGDTLFPRPTGVVPHNTPSPVPVLRLQPASFGLSEDEMSIKMASISRTNSLNLHAGFAAMDVGDDDDGDDDGTSVSNPSFSTTWGANANQIAKDIGVTVIDDQHEARPRDTGV